MGSDDRQRADGGANKQHRGEERAGETGSELAGIEEREGHFNLPFGEPVIGLNLILQGACQLRKIVMKQRVNVGAWEFARE